ncbi:MAG: hypothetical protein IT310_14060 [Anaerolineales bacterium]|nr:hypothetical protein [Anaerolineales bacterium]
MRETPSPLQIPIKPAKTAFCLLLGSLLVMGLSLFGQRFRFFDGYRISGPVQDYFLRMFINQFFVNSEGNVATFWNALILILIAGLAFIIAALKFSEKDRYRFEWFFLGAVFLFLSMDEASVIHEKFNVLLKNLPDLNGWTHYKWLYAGVVVVGLLTLAFVRFYLHLDWRNKILFPVSMGLYLLGAFGGELFSGKYAQYYGTKNITYTLLTHAEELGEQIGIILMIYTLLAYLAKHYSQIRFHVEGEND